jgi:4-amino-4-deoxy-L-arabinose transferase-like glycosyltransferase
VLVFPDTVLWPHVVALRVYLAGLSAVGLVAAFAPWLRLMRPPAVALAALTFATTWFTVYFGTAVQPNYWVALAGVAAVGLVGRALKEPHWRWYALLGTVVAFAAFIRPSDSVWLVLPLGVVGLWRLRRRELGVLAAVVAGEVVGWLPWVIEAYVDFGGPLARYRAANATGAVGGFHPNSLTPTMYLRLLDGPFYSYPSNVGAAGGYDRVWMTWLVVLVALAAAGIALRRRTEDAGALRLALAAAVTVGVFYVVLLSYAAPRFLLPTLALLSLPAAAGLVALADAARRRPSRVWRATALVVPGLLVAGHLALQIPNAHRWGTARSVVTTSGSGAVTALRRLHFQRPCLILGDEDIAPMAWALRCHVAGISPTGTAEAARTARLRASVRDVVVVSRESHLGPEFAGWEPLSIPHVTWHVWLPPGRSSAR